MRTYIIKRLLLIIPTLFEVSIIIFFLIRLVPGNIADAIMAAPGNEALDRAVVESTFGLDAPLLTQYGRWLGAWPQADGSFSGLFQGNFGVSWWRGSTVVELVAAIWPTSLQLGLMGLIISQLIALPIGVYSALRQDTWGDYISRSFAILSISIPSFWIATLVIVYPSIWWGYMPPLMYTPFFKDPLGNLRMFIVPAILLGMAMAGVTMRMTRTMMLEVLRQDYIRTAWAKGLRERLIVIRHALKNALIPVITIVGIQVPVLVGGTVIIEQIFVLPGMGRLILSAVTERDYPLVTGIMVFFSVAIVLINLMVDLTYAYLDPRVHYR